MGRRWGQRTGCAVSPPGRGGAQGVTKGNGPADALPDFPERGQAPGLPQTLPRASFLSMGLEEMRFPKCSFNPQLTADPDTGGTGSAARRPAPGGREGAGKSLAKPADEVAAVWLPAVARPIPRPCATGPLTEDPLVSFSSQGKGKEKAIIAPQTGTGTAPGKRQVV